MKKNVISIHQNNFSQSTCTAYVKGISESSFIVETENGLINTKKAFGCLIEPLPEDKVLVSISERESYILSILERSTDKNVSLEFPGDVKFKMANGKFDIISSKDINIISAEKTDIFSPILNITSLETKINAKKMKTDINKIEVTAKYITVFSKSIDTISERISQTAKNIMRRVEGVETLSVGNLIQNIKKVFTQNSYHTVITAKKDMKIDAERIHMG